MVASECNSPIPSALNLSEIVIIASQSTGQIVALLKMLRKYGPGWQTRTVRAQRS